MNKNVKLKHEQYIMEQQHRIKGLLLALVVVMLWGVQPFFMKVALIKFDSYAVSAFRLIFASLIIFLLLVKKDKKVLFMAIKNYWWQLLLAALLIATNYFTFLKAIELGGPITATILIQSGPLMLILIGIFILRESFSVVQSLAGISALFGFYLFFYDRITNAANISLQIDASILVFIAAITWALFCVIQKVIGAKTGIAILNSSAFLFAGIMLLPFVEFNQFSNWKSISFLCIVYLTFSTVIAYTSLGEALKLLPTSTVSLIITTNPFVTLLCIETMYLLGNTFFEPLPLSTIGYLGATVAIIGVGTAVSRK